MKGAVFCFVFLVARVLAQTPCTTSGDCMPNECCVGTPLVTTGSFCRPRGEIGDHCYVSNDQFLANDCNTVYHNSCPCQSNEFCQGTGLLESPQGEHGRCTASPNRVGRAVCSTSADCASDECCATASAPLIFGKKRQTDEGGECQKLGKLGDRSLTVQDINVMCPCSSILDCMGTGVYMIGYGPLGHCEINI